ncbi:hypothetical protein BV22DRAFT_581051 [Leucogyrophana mollusca]|uniref:Uncharacterized protein n=1 Tax=Leucogyrophana mollusca TaxID=85980 RepID=A0ACB8BE87_9AGAM|nr:hypothetical protein BV22DRAFT_581051 [Leucogyrophana mollusca]
MYCRRSRVITIASLFVASSREVLASTAACLSSANYGWASNSLGQDPCAVANALFSTNPPPCNNTISFGPLASGGVYPAPTLTDATNCLCNTVIYSLVSACADCQDEVPLVWTTWTDDCPEDITLYYQWPTWIASNTGIPQWAYLPLVAYAWDPTQAQKNATQGPGTSTQSTTQASTHSTSTSSEPSSRMITSLSATSTTTTTSHKTTESSLPHPTSSTLITTATSGKTTESSNLSPTSTASNSSSSVGSSNLTDSIIGGVVGGVTGAAALTFLVIFTWCRRSRHKTGSNPSGFTLRKYHFDKNLIGRPAPIFDPNGSATRLYNPDDPSTFPRTPPPVIDMAWAGAERPQSVNNTGHYSGTPEL